MRRITLKVDKTWWNGFEREIVEPVCIRRDAYLARILRQELPEIAKGDWVNDDYGLAHLKGRRKGAETIQVCLSLPTDICDALGVVSKKKLVPRNEIINAVLEYLYFAVQPQVIGMSKPGEKGWCHKDWQYMLGEPAEVLLDLEGHDDEDAAYDAYLREHQDFDFYERRLHVTQEILRKQQEFIDELIAKFNESKATKEKRSQGLKRGQKDD